LAEPDLQIISIECMIYVRVTTGYDESITPNYEEMFAENERSAITSVYI